MKLSYEWLKEYVDIKESAEELARGLTMSGSEVGAMHASGKDKVMDLEITSNRPDCLNILGLAREAAAVFKKKLKTPVTAIPEKISEKDGPKVKCIIENKELCSSYTARVITGVKVKPASGKITKRIEALGMRPVNNIVDVTNYCLMELGQPLHAFDLDKIKGGKIIVREAQKGEKIVTIDGEERELEAGMLVIADSERPVAIAGLMGGMDTEVTDSTTNMLLESAYFDPVSVRSTGRKLGLSSESSYRFERGVDKGMIKGASDRAAVLIIDEAGGDLCAFYEAGSLNVKETMIVFDIKRSGEILGVDIDKKETIGILERLGMDVAPGKGEMVKVKVPSFREDIKNPVDLTEEVARIYGYDKIPATVPSIKPVAERKKKERLVSEKIIECLTSLGLDEIMTYSLISEDSSSRMSDLVKDPVSLSNPLSEEHKVLTPHLVDGMLKTITWNMNRRNKDLALFEMGKIYSKLPKGKGYSEAQTVCLGITGLAVSDWLEGRRGAGFYDLKGIVENLFSVLRLTPEFFPVGIKGMAPCAGIKICSQKNIIGFLGQVTAPLLRQYDIDQDVFLCQLRIDTVIESADLEKSYHSVPRFPSSDRDISILCEKNIAAQDISRIIIRTGDDLIRDVELVDVYEGKNIPDDRKSLTYSIRYGLDTRTLKEEEIESIHSKVKQALTKDLGVVIR